MRCRESMGKAARDGGGGTNVVMRGGGRENEAREEQERNRKNNGDHEYKHFQDNAFCEGQRNEDGSLRGREARRELFLR